MRTDVASSSLEIYDAMKGAGFAALQALILSRMKYGKLYTRRQISKMTKLETSCVAGRVKELIDMDMVVVCGKTKCPITGNKVEAIKRADGQFEIPIS